MIQHKINENEYGKEDSAQNQCKFPAHTQHFFFTSICRRGNFFFIQKLIYSEQIQTEFTETTHYVHTIFSHLNSFYY